MVSHQGQGQELEEAGEVGVTHPAGSPSTKLGVWDCSLSTTRIHKQGNSKIYFTLTYCFERESYLQMIKMAN